eukprot:12741424-Alexandrium_andersonii.AAC.1
MCGGLWSAHEAAKAGFQADASCPRCGHHMGTVWHLLWECESFASERAECLEFLRRYGGVGALPHNLVMHGLAPLLSVASQGPLWPVSGLSQHCTPE